MLFNDTSNIRINKKHYKFKHNNAYNSCTERDFAMMELASDVIGYIYQYGGAGSATMHNIMTIQAKKLGRLLTPGEVTKLIRKHSMDNFVDGMARFIATELTPKVGEELSHDYSVEICKLLDNITIDNEGKK
jgi:hypothetical protein